ncbi:MAG TPA: ABC transporter permease [Cyclobacteriaceae bacterium]|nr:ABC transporter permease [Cyclobacteriaceae bacterium]
MNLSYFLARRISREQKGGFASTIHTIAVVTLAIGLAASIVSFLIMEGFQATVKDRIYSFSANLLVTKLSLSNSMEEQPFSFNIDLYNHPEQFKSVKHVQEFSHKAGLIKTDEDVLGIVFKGVGKRFDQEAFASNLKEGRFIHFPDSGYSREVLISQSIANKINVKPGDEIIVHFFQDPPRFRRLTITGIYETNLSEYFDSKVIVGDLKLIQRLNQWPDSVAGGLEVYLSDIERVDDVYQEIGETIPFNLYIEKVSEKFSQVFQWLELVSRQVRILLGVILTVVCVNMISVILILVMERTQMIGLLKAVGANNSTIRSVFVYQGMNLIARGLFFGNIIGLGLCYLQDKFKFIKLNPHDYYMSFVPIAWDWTIVVVLNILVFVVVTVVLLLPAAIVSRIQPIKAIRFD